jgi:hypothetical protein
LATALSDAEDNHTHWAAELLAEQAKTAGLAALSASTGVTSSSADSAVTALTTDYTTKRNLWLGKKALYDTDKLKWDALKAIVDAKTGEISANTAAAAAPSTAGFSTAEGELKTQATALRDKHALFLTDFNANQAATQWTGLGTDTKCDTATEYDADEGGKDTLAKCETACLAKKYLTYTTWVSGTTNYDTEWKTWYDANSNTGANASYSSGKSGCLGFKFTTVTDVCRLYDTLVPTAHASPESNS